MWVACYGDLMVKIRVHAAGKQTFLPQLATFRLRCYQHYIWVLSLEVAS